MGWISFPRRLSTAVMFAAALQVRAAQYQATVGLIRALGGGWGETPG